jgi:hypothetical protein
LKSEWNRIFSEATIILGSYSRQLGSIFPLSAGGLRDTRFHLGGVRFLYDAGLLNNETHICAVSGGSILAHLVQHWHSYPVGADGSNSTTALQPQRSQRAAINSSNFTSAAPSGDTSARPVRQAVARAGKCWTTAPAPLRSLPMAIYQRHRDGSIWRFVGPPCSGTSCPAWSHLDNNPSATSMAAGGFN